jgi:hypothetical protein
MKDAPSREVLAKISCTETGAELKQARNENKPENERLAAYLELYQSLRKRAHTFEVALDRNPDLFYSDGSELSDARQTCIQQTADVKNEFEKLVREVVEVPTVKEVKGGNEVVAARVDYRVLREALEALDPDDKDQLLGEVATAEKRVESSTKKRGK